MVFPNVSVTNQTVQVTVSPGGDGAAYLSGIQVVPASGVPPPQLTISNLLNLNFGAVSGYKTGPAAVGLTTNDFWNGGLQWNNYAISVAPLTNADLSRSPAGLLVQNAPGVWNNSIPDNMYQNYLYGSSGDVWITLTNLPAGDYDFYCYGHSASDADNTFFQIWTGDRASDLRPTTLLGSGWNGTNWQDGQQFVVFHDLEVKTNESVVIQAGHSSLNYATINGMQIVYKGPADTNANGLADAWEMRYFGCLTNSATGDPDNDGISNAHEYQIGFDPTAASTNWNAGEIVWVEDSVPIGAYTTASGDSWNWTGAWTNNGTLVTPWSGSLMQLSTLTSGTHYHQFWYPDASLRISTNDYLICYINTDAANPPSEIMLQWYVTAPGGTGSWEHRAYWGTNLITSWGTDGTASRTNAGALPTPGQWTRLQVPASAVGLPGAVIEGISFTLYNGRAAWDRAGKLITNVDDNGLPDTWQIQHFGCLGVDPMGDPDGDGLSNQEEYQNGTNPNAYDQACLGWWHFDNAPGWADAAGLTPSVSSGVMSLPSWSTNAAWMSSALNSDLAYPWMRPNGSIVVKERAGSVQFWFKPDWSSDGSTQPPGPQDTIRLFEVGRQSTGATYGWLALTVDPLGSKLTLSTEANGVHTDNAVCPISLNAEDWYQITATYTTSNCFIYVNGQYNVSWTNAITNGVTAYGFSTNVAGTGLTNLPSAAVFAAGFHLGCSWDGVHQANGRFDELQTFNYPLSSNTIAANYQSIISVDANHNGIPDVIDNALADRPYGSSINCNGLPASWQDTHGLNSSSPAPLSADVYLAYATGKLFPVVAQQNMTVAVTPSNLLNVAFVPAASQAAGSNFHWNILQGTSAPPVWNLCDTNSDYVHGVALTNAAGGLQNASLYAFIGPCSNSFLNPYGTPGSPPPWIAPDQTYYLRGVNEFLDPMGYASLAGELWPNSWWGIWSAENAECGPQFTYGNLQLFWNYFGLAWATYPGCSTSTINPLAFYYSGLPLFPGGPGRTPGPFFSLPSPEKLSLLQAFTDSSSYATNLADYIDSLGAGGVGGAYPAAGCAACFLTPFQGFLPSPTNSIAGTCGAAWRWFPMDVNATQPFGTTGPALGSPGPYTSWFREFYPEAQRTLWVTGLKPGQYFALLYYVGDTNTVATFGLQPAAAPALMNGVSAPSYGNPLTGQRFWHALVSTQTWPAPTNFNAYVGAPAPPWALTNGGGTIAITLPNTMYSSAPTVTGSNDVQLLGLQLLTGPDLQVTNQFVIYVPGPPQAVAQWVFLAWPPVGTDTVYNVYRTTNSTSNPWTLLATVTNQFDYQDLGLALGTTYYYQVLGVNGSGMTNGTALGPTAVVPSPCNCSNCPTLPPVIDYVTPLDLPSVGGSYAFTAQNLQANSDAFDPQGLTLQFVVDSVTSGSLLINGKPFTAANSTLGATNPAVWIPPAGVPSTNLPAFFVHVFNGVYPSTNSVSVQFGLPGPPLHLYSWGLNAFGQVGNGSCLAPWASSWNGFPFCTEALLQGLTDPLNLQMNAGIMPRDPRWTVRTSERGSGYRKWQDWTMATPFPSDPSSGSPVKAPVSVLDGDNLAGLSVTYNYTMAIGVDGAIRMWGYAPMDSLFGRPFVLPTSGCSNLFAAEYSQVVTFANQNDYFFLPLLVPTPVPFAGSIPTAVTSVLSLPYGALALGADGSLWSWGWMGWLDIPSGYPSLSTTSGCDLAAQAFHWIPDGVSFAGGAVYPEPVFPGDTTPVVEVAGDEMSGIICRKADGTVWWWGGLLAWSASDSDSDLTGENIVCYLTQPPATNGYAILVPTEVTSLELPGVPPIVQMSAALEHFVFLRQDGSVSEMGYLSRWDQENNSFGWDAGSGITDGMPSFETASHLVSSFSRDPVPVLNLPTNICQVAASGTFGAALTTDGNVWVWGVAVDNAWILNPSPNMSREPRQIPGFQNIRKIVMAGPAGILGVDQSGYVWSWGYSPQAAPVLGPGFSEIQLDVLSIPGLVNVQDIYASPSGWAVYATGLIDPNIPTGLAATPMNAQIQISWNACPGASYYVVYRSLNRTAGYSPVATNATPSFLDQGPGLQNGQTYYYRVSSVTSGDVSAPSATIAATPISPPAPVQNLTATVACQGVLVQWTAPASGPLNPPESYLVQKGSTLVASLLTNVTSYYDPAGTTGQVYTVVAWNTASQVSNTVVASSANAIPCASAPVVLGATNDYWLTDINVSDATDQCDLSWAGPSGPTTNWPFQVYEFPGDNFINVLASTNDAVSARLWLSLSPTNQAVITDLSLPLGLRLSTLTAALNPLLGTTQAAGVNGSLLLSSDLSNCTLRPATSNLLYSSSSPTNLVQLNRMLLDDYYSSMPYGVLFTRGPNWGSGLTGFVINYRMHLLDSGYELGGQYQIAVGLTDLQYVSDASNGQPCWGLYHYPWPVIQGAACWASVSAIVGGIQGNPSTQLGPVFSTFADPSTNTWATSIRAIPGYEQVYLDWADADLIASWDVLFSTNGPTGTFTDVPGGTNLQVNRCWHTNLVAGSTYWYQLIAYLVDGRTIMSGVVSATVTNAPAPIVTNFSATAFPYDSMVMVEWKVPKTNATNPDIINQTNWQFYVERKVSALGDTNYQAISAVGFGLAYLDTGLTNGTAYTYRVTAFDMAFNRLQALAAVGGTNTQVTPSAAGALTLLPPTPGNSFVDLAWTPVLATQFTIERGTSPSGPFDTAGYVSAKSAFGTAPNTYRDTGLVNGTTYYYWIAATTPTGYQLNSPVASATPLATLTPLPPQDFQGIVAAAISNTNGATNMVLLSWTEQTGVDSYEVFLRNQTQWGRFWSGAALSCNYLIPANAASDAVFTFGVRAIGSAGSPSDLATTDVTNQAPAAASMPMAQPVMLFVAGCATNALTVLGPTNLALSATVNVPNVLRVYFYDNNTCIGSSDPPFQFTWYHAPSGTHSLTATAVTANPLWGGTGPSYDSSSVSVVVQILSPLSAYQTSVTDLQLPGPGLPLSLSRFYSSRNTNSDVSLGVGWTATWNAPNVTLSANLTTGWAGVGQTDPITGQHLDYVSDLLGHSALVTLPDGSTAAFAVQCMSDATNTGDYFDYNGSADLVFGYQPLALGQGTLVSDALGPFLVDADAYGYTWPTTNLALVPTNNPTAFTYTGPDGTQYYFAQQTNSSLIWRLSSVADLTGNFLTYNYDPSGRVSNIVHSCGRQLRFAYPNPGEVDVYDSIGLTGVPAVKYLLVNGQLTQALRLVNRAGSGQYETNAYAYGSVGFGQNRLTDVYGLNGVLTLHNVYTNYNGDLCSQATPGRTNTFFFNPTNFNLMLQTATATATNTALVTSDTSGAISGATTPIAGTTPASSTSVQCTYDPQGNLVQQTDANGNTKTYTYDSMNRLVGQSDENGNSTSVQLDAHGKPEITTNALGNLTISSYNAQGNPFFTRDPSGTVTTNTYYSAWTNASGSALGELPASMTQTAPGVPGQVVTLYSYRTNAAQGILGDELSVTVQSVQGGVVVASDTTSYAYDANGNRTAEIRTRSVNSGIQTITNAYTYDAENRVIMTVVSAGGAEAFPPQTNFVLYSCGKQVASIDAAGRTNFNVYDFNGNLIEVQNPDGTVNRTCYDGFGHQLCVQDRAVPDSNNQTLAPATFNTYDASGRVIMVQRFAAVSLTNLAATSADCAGPAGLWKMVAAAPQSAALTTTLTYYDAVGRVQYAVDARGTVTQYNYDPAGRRTNVLVYTVYAFGPTGVGANTPAPSNACLSTIYSYDANGNQIAVIDALGRTTKMQYDSGNRLIEVDSPTANGGTLARKTYYDGLGRKVQETDEAGVSTAFVYDYRGLLLAVTLGASSASPLTTVYAYDEVGNQIAQTDALQRTTTFHYDALGRRTGRTLPGGQVEATGYDLAGNPTNQVSFKGVVITNRYDVMGRLLSRSAPGFQASYAYNLLGWRTNMTDASGVTAFQYDGLGRLTNKAVAWANGPSVALNYAYDSLGGLTNLWSSSTGGVANACQYDELGRLTNVLANGTLAASYGYDAVGNLQSVGCGNGVTNLFQYDPMNRLTNLVWGRSATLLAAFAYTVAPTGNRLALAESVNGTARTYAWTYDNIYRLTSETIGNLGALTYKYDAVGNRTNRVSGISSIPGQSLGFTTNDWLASDSYDPNGNTTNSGGTAYQYDPLNHLVSAAGGTVTITYDADGNRASKTVGGTTTYYLLDDRNPSGYAQVLEEWTVGSGGTNLARVYNYGLQLISQRVPGTSTNYFVYDGHGSTRLLADAGGNVANTFAYDAYGILVASNSLPQTAYLYSGQQFDTDLGMYYLRARYYQQGTGRFWTLDTFEGDTQDPVSLHSYLYCKGNPVIGSDPSGHEDLISLSIGSTLSASFEAMYNGGVSAAGNAMQATLLGVQAGQTANDILSGYLLNETGVQSVLDGFQALQSLILCFGGTPEELYSVYFFPDYDAMVLPMLLGQESDLEGINATYTSPQCLIAGTLIETADGLRAIETIQRGDRVWAWNQYTSQRELRNVLSTFKRQRDRFVTVRVDDDTVVVATPDHPFFMADNTWRAAGDILVGSALFDENNQEGRKVRSVVESTGSCTVYNMEVDGLHNYFVTSDRILTHNTVAGYNHYFMRSFQKVINLEHALGYGERILGAQRWLSARKHTKYHDALNAFLRSRNMLPRPGYSSRDIFLRFGEPTIIQTFRQFYRQKWPQGKDLFEKELKAFLTGNGAIK